jgi:pimeloyl-ACP methyl ester carboxylesterase
MRQNARLDQRRDDEVTASPSGPVAPGHEFRRHWPHLADLVWLNTPSIAPAADAVAAALWRSIDRWQRGERVIDDWEDDIEACRTLIARLLGQPRETVALVGSLAEAASLVAASLPPGQVVVAADEFRSNVFPWLALGERGREVVVVPPRRGLVADAAPIAAITPQARLVAVSEVTPWDGHHRDLGTPSLGGMVVQEVALRHPSRVGAVVLAATTEGLPRLDLMPVRILPRLLRDLVLPVARDRARDERVRRFLRVSVSAQLAVALTRDDPLWHFVARLLDEPFSSAGRRRQIAAGARHSTWSRLGDIRAPTLVFHGTDDPLIPARAGRELARRIPGARFEPIEGAGHVLILERTEEVTELVMEFIARHDGLVL